MKFVALGLALICGRAKMEVRVVRGSFRCRRFRIS